MWSRVVTNVLTRYETWRFYKLSRVKPFQMCVAINGLDYMRRWLLDLGDELRVEQILAALENQANESVRYQWRNALLTPLEQTPGQMMIYINQIISRIGAKVGAKRLTPPLA